MLWMKGWFETRWRFVFGLCFVVFVLINVAVDNVADQPFDIAKLVNVLAFFCAFIAIMLGGAGINTQAAFRATKGLHGSMYFTLALPVSRFRLLATRAATGVLELTAVIMLSCAGIWATVPQLRAQMTLPEILVYGLALAVSTASFYSVSVLLATFLDGQWQIWGSMIFIMGLRYASNHLPVPAGLDLFRPLTANSPLATHILPWSGMAMSVVMAAILFGVSLKIVQLREY
jgi:ABC-type transport system involved in multi-copper enzyme maturation permease subunit